MQPKVGTKRSHFLPPGHNSEEAEDYNDVFVHVLLPCVVRLMRVFAKSITHIHIDLIFFNCILWSDKIRTKNTKQKFMK